MLGPPGLVTLVTGPGTAGMLGPPGLVTGSGHTGCELLVLDT